jgi:hypothetical protein
LDLRFGVAGADIFDFGDSGVGVLPVVEEFFKILGGFGGVAQLFIVLSCFRPSVHF